MAKPADGAGNLLVLVRTTLPDAEAADRMARGLVERGLAACVHASPLRSTYRWGGKLEQEDEVLLEARTTPEHADAVWEHLLKNHPYELPLVEILGGVKTTARYAAWARDALRPRPPG